MKRTELSGSLAVVGLEFKEEGEVEFLEERGEEGHFILCMLDGRGFEGFGFVFVWMMKLGVVFVFVFGWEMESGSRMGGKGKKRREGGKGVCLPFPKWLVVKVNVWRK